MRKYKVITNRDSAFGGEVELDVLERVLNEYAARGWRVVTALDGESFASAIMVILERPEPVEEGSS